jgi:hypothetical protein
MFRTFAMAAALVFSLGSGLLAQSVAGAWDLSINGPEGPITAAVTLKQDGEKVTGSIESPQGTAELTGAMKGKTLTMAFQIQSPQGPLDIKVTGDVDGATMKGMIDFGMGMADFTAKKK